MHENEKNRWKEPGRAVVLGKSAGWPLSSMHRKPVFKRQRPHIKLVSSPTWNEEYCTGKRRNWTRDSAQHDCRLRNAQD